MNYSNSRVLTGLAQGILGPKASFKLKPFYIIKWFYFIFYLKSILLISIDAIFFFNEFLVHYLVVHLNFSIIVLFEIMCAVINEVRNYKYKKRES